MIREKRSLSKTEFTDTFAYCPDASDLFSFSSGAVLFQFSLPSEIKNGVMVKSIFLTIFCFL